MAQQDPRRGIWAMLKDGYEVLVQNVIRPIRAEYVIHDLGPKRVLIDGILTNRMDLQLKNKGGFNLECSWWKPDFDGRRYGSSEITRSDQSKSSNKRPPCIVVLHGNCSCRVGSLDIVRIAVPAGFSVFSLDFAGSGHSEVRNL